MNWSLGHLAIFIPMLGMVGAFILNQVAQWRRTSRQIERDARRLRAALLTELRLLRSMVADNLVLIRDESEYLLSFRAMFQIYRVNVGRLNLLHEREIQAVIHAYGVTETAEVFAGAVTRPHGAHSYRVWLGEGSWQEIQRRLLEALGALDIAINGLERVRRTLSPLRPLRPGPTLRTGIPEPLGPPELEPNRDEPIEDTLPPEPEHEAPSPEERAHPVHLPEEVP